ncbi:MAG: hypothetical protein OEZ36_00455, partial [Spirochaetota bacterium]|nr:hypothetical protein [Spirochaetota bacterium]
MRLINLLALSLLIVLYGVQNGESRRGAKYGLFMENVSFVEKGKRVSGKLCVIPYKDKEGVPGSRWMLLRSDSYFARDLGDVNPGFAIVNNVKASPDMKYLAVETVGEGQVSIQILDLQKLLAGEKTESLYQISAHPGMAHIVMWKRGLLMLSSDIFLEQKNNEVQARHSNFLLS